MESTCPDAAIWETYLDGSIGETNRAMAESHLATCRLCRVRLIGLFDSKNEAEAHEQAPYALTSRAVRLVPEKPIAKPFFNFFRPYAPVALAATIVLAVGLSVLVYHNRPESPSIGDLRQSGGGRSEIVLTNPPNDAVVNSGKLEFRWNDAGGGGRYEFVLIDEKGDIVFQERAATNPLSLETSALRLSPGRKYYWSVTARLPDGTRRESPIAGFTMK